MDAEEYNRRGRFQFNSNAFDIFIGLLYLCNEPLLKFWKVNNVWIVVNVSVFQTAKELVDYITEYLGSIRDRKVIPEVKPGYMRELLPDSAPSEPDSWDSIFKDIERVIMPGVRTFTQSRCLF